MKGIHPNTRQMLSLAALAALGVAGCRTPSGSVSNPFLAPDRVPPPATRAILPGQAQPYYPGDPLPVMQSQAAPTVDSRGLTWGAPQDNAVQEAATTAAPSPTAPTVPRTKVITPGEPVVAIPADTDSLRFSLPPTGAEPAPITPIAPSPIQAAANVPTDGVTQASYSEPSLQSVEPMSPWRQPQISQATLPPSPTAQPAGVAQAAYTAPLATAFVPMDVQLRAVPSPPPDSSVGSSPRIRFGGEAAPQTASMDGFRPRSSMR